MKIKLSRRKKILVAGLILAITGGYLAYDALNKEEKTYSQLTGIEVSKDVADSPILGVMIENSEAARPQTGLDAAGIVVETVTEGGITRYLAMYQETMPSDVGPVRSLRPFFVDTVLGFDVSVAHVGGSAEALKTVTSKNVKSLSQFQYTEPYYRVDFRSAPHNMYANTEKLRALQKSLGHKKSSFSEIPRSDQEAGTNLRAKEISIDFSGPLYKVQFKYEPSSNSYTRYLAGQLHLDAATKKPITVKNVVVIKTTGNELSAQGNGEALVFLNGDAKKVKWQKTGQTDRIKLIDENGAEIPLNRGDSWFAILPKGKEVTY